MHTISIKEVIQHLANYIGELGHSVHGWGHFAHEIDKKKVAFKNQIKKWIFYKHKQKKVNWKYFNVSIWIHCALNWVYGKLYIKFEDFSIAKKDK